MALCMRTALRSSQLDEAVCVREQAEGDQIAALDDNELEHDADVELAEAERVVNAEERELAPYGVDLNKVGGAYVPVALCDGETRACSKNAALNRPDQHFTYEPAA